MANSKQILDKLARNLDQLSIAYTRAGNNVVVTNGSNALTVSYTNATIGAPMGGVDGNTSPFLGIGTANPGKIAITSSIHTAGSMADIMDSKTAAQLLQMVSAWSNNIVLSNDNASYTAELRGCPDLIGMGQ
jgi:hypothetical protein